MTSNRYYCGNNALHRSLKNNGGSKIFGTHDQCFKKGYGVGYNAPVSDVERFIAEWSGPYKPYIVQKLLYGSDKVEPGFQRATLAQRLQRGFALGSVARGKELARKGQGPSSKQKPTLPVRTTRR